MKRSTDRILTTHVGSLPRPADLLDAVRTKEAGKPIDEKTHAVRLRAAVAEVVRKQVDLGIDIIDDGEYGKPSFVSYVNERLGGFEFDREVPRLGTMGCWFWYGALAGRSWPRFRQEHTRSNHAQAKTVRDRAPALAFQTRARAHASHKWHQPLCAPISILLLTRSTKRHRWRAV